MKKIMVLITLVLGLTANASHMMGGILQISNTGPDSTTIGLYLVADGFPGSNQYVSVELWSMNSSGWYTLQSFITLDKVTQSTHQGTSTANYVSDYLDLDSNKYRIIYKNCCWPVLNNNASSSPPNEVVISMDYWHMADDGNHNWIDSSPYMENPLWVNMQKDSVNTMKPVWGLFNCFFTNPGLDSVNLYQTELYKNYANGVFVPQTQSPSNMYVGNDSITFVSSTLGPVGNGFQIDGYQNGNLVTVQRIQWTFRVVASTIGIEEDIVYRDTQYSVYDWSGRYIGDNINWSELKGLYVIRYNNGKVEKVLCN